MTKTTTLNVADLELCDRTRVRAQKPKDGGDIVLEYAEAYRCGLIVEPLDVFREKGTERYVVADGEHRLLALRSAKIKAVECRLHDGDEVAALDFAIGCNQAHGVRRTKADRYHSFVRIMETPALQEKYRTDTDLAEKIGVSKSTISAYKVEWRNSESDNKASRRAKAEAKESAAKNTPKAAAPRTEVKKTPTSEQKRVAAQVRESVAAKPADKSPRPPPKSEQRTSKGDPLEWSKDDEQSADTILEALSNLGKAWKAATRAAQIHTAEVIAESVKDMR